MKKFLKIINKSERLLIGILSGTSVDAVDVILVRFKGSATKLKYKVINYKEYKIPAEIKDYVFKVSSRNTGHVDDICKLNFILGKYYSDCINKFLRTYKISNDRIDAIGSHGQTIHHLPMIEKYGKIVYKSTLQIGDPSVIANNTGIITVGDFRNADVGVMGDGAPLVPYLDFVLFRSNKIGRILLNIGGISNLTYLPVNCNFNDVKAFDTGPGNMMIDYLTKKYFNKDYDKDCKYSGKGKLNKKLFDELLRADTFLMTKPPKSTGREFYNSHFIEEILKIDKKAVKEDIIRTFTEYTAFSIAEHIKRYIRIKNDFEILVSGGGAKNKVLIEGLRRYCKNASIRELDYDGITTSNKEAFLFALLAHETLNLRSTNLKSVTGAKKNVILGKICIA